MKWLRPAVLIFVVAVLQAGLINILEISSMRIKPDLLLILMVSLAIFSDLRDAIILSFVIGFIADVIATGQPMGPRTISFGLIGTLLSNVHNVLLLRKLPHQIAAVFFSGLLAGSISNFLIFVATQLPVSNSFFSLFASSLYSCLISPFLILPISLLINIKAKRIKT